MSKEMEAFMKYCPIIPSENNFKYWSDYQIALKKYERELQTFTKTFELLKKALTPPTADEVCKALKSYFGHHVDKIFYDNESKSFRDEINPNLVEYLFDITYLKDIPPHLITLIGRFYEAQQ